MFPPSRYCNSSNSEFDATEPVGFRPLKNIPKKYTGNPISEAFKDEAVGPLTRVEKGGALLCHAVPPVARGQTENVTSAEAAVVLRKSPTTRAATDVEATFIHIGERMMVACAVRDRVLKIWAREIVSGGS